MNNLYQELILDHNKHPKNFGKLDDANKSAEGFNPLCGDHFWVDLDIQNDEIKDIKFHGQGCAISTASASMMTDIIKEKSIKDAQGLYNVMHDLFTKPNSPVPHNQLEVFSNIHNYPTRVKCASLPWHTLKAALDNNKQASTE